MIPSELGRPEEKGITTPVDYAPTLTIKERLDLQLEEAKAEQDRLLEQGNIIAASRRERQVRHLSTSEEKRGIHAYLEQIASGLKDSVQKTCDAHLDPTSYWMQVGIAALYVGSALGTLAHVAATVTAIANQAAWLSDGAHALRTTAEGVTAGAKTIESGTQATLAEEQYRQGRASRLQDVYTGRLNTKENETKELSREVKDMLNKYYEALLAIIRPV